MDTNEKELKKQQEELLKKIALEVYNSGWLTKQCYSMSKDKMLMDDLVQDLLIDIMTYPNDKLIECYNKNEHLYFLKKMITNQYCSTQSKFYYTYRKFVGEDIENYIELEDNSINNLNNEEIY